jgi:hypothetical protein
MALAMALLVEATVATLMPAHGFTMLYGVLYVAAAAGVWALLVVVAVLAAIASDKRAAAPSFSPATL